MADFLAPAYFVDSDHPAVRAFAEKAVTGVSGEKRRALALYYAVRDNIIYDPYLDFNDIEIFRASMVLARGRGFCIGKSSLLSACARAVGIQARPGFADVRNHLTSRKLRDLIEGDDFIWHSYTDLNIDGAWVKCTPAFDRVLCERARIKPMEFDGVNDSLFHPFDAEGRKYMEYLLDRGGFEDVPVETILAAFHKRYPRMMAYKPEGNFHAEVGT